MGDVEDKKGSRFAGTVDEAKCGRPCATAKPHSQMVGISTGHVL